jgi:hypothetical protein
MYLLATVYFYKNAKQHGKKTNISPTIYLRQTLRYVGQY